MTNRQRALVSALVYVVRNRRFFNWHRIGVRDAESGKTYEFHGEFMPIALNMQDDKYNQIRHQTFYDNPWKVKFSFISRQGTDQIELKIWDKSSSFEGQDGDYYHFDGRCYANSDQVEISDNSQDKRRYLYRIIW